MISLILIVVLKLTFPKPITNIEELNEFWITKTHGKGKYDIVVCGDSRIYRGFSIEALNEDLPLKYRGINLGYSSGGFSEEYLDFALSKLDTNSFCPVLVLGITPHSLTAEAFKNNAYHSYKSLGSFKIYKGSYLSFALKHFAPYKLQELIDDSKVNYMQECHSDGWIASSYLISDSTEALTSYKKTFSKYQIDNKEVDVFLSKIKDITSNGITVVAFRPPNTSVMRHLEDSISGFDERLVKQNLLGNSVIWLDFEDADFESYDGSHLHYKSAKKLSGMIGEKIHGLCR